MKRASVFKLAGLFVFLFGFAAFAGDLEPSGPPASTMKPLDQVEPRIPITSVPLTITQSGSYYLTKNLTVTDTTINAITVEANNVTIDLCGFILTGPNSGTNHGIYMPGRKTVEIHNGTITCFSKYGIYEGSPGQNHRVIGIRSVSNGLGGIRLIGSSNLVKDCVVSDNGASVMASTVYGISGGSGSIVSGNLVYNNGDSATGNVRGIYAYSGSTITGNSVVNNGASASGQILAIYAHSGCTISGNTVCANGASASGGVTGIDAGSGCIVTGNAVNNNAESATGASVFGILAGTGAAVKGNSVCSNGISASGTRYGIYLVGYNLVDQNTLYDNGTNIGQDVSAAGIVITSSNVAP